MWSVLHCPSGPFSGHRTCKKFRSPPTHLMKSMRKISGNFRISGKCISRNGPPRGLVLPSCGSSFAESQSFLSASSDHPSGVNIRCYWRKARCRLWDRVSYLNCSWLLALTPDSLRQQIRSFPTPITLLDLPRLSQRIVTVAMSVCPSDSKTQRHRHSASLLTHVARPL